MRFLPLLLLAACPLGATDDTDGTACTEIAAVSVSVLVTDMDGNPLTPTTVTWSVDGGESQPAQCWDEDCTQFAAGTEIPGVITVTASLSGEVEGDPCCTYDSSDTDTKTIEMDAQGCHVVGQSMVLTLDPDQQICADDCG